MRATEALEEHATLAQALADPLVRRYVDLMAQRDMGLPGGSQCGATAANHVTTAYTFHLAEKMADTVTRHALNLPDATMVRDHEPPTITGVMVLDRPWELYDLHNKLLRISMVTWGPIHVRFGSAASPTERGTLYSLWQNTSRARDEYTDIVEADPQFAIVAKALRGMHPVNVGIAPNTKQISLQASENASGVMPGVEGVIRRLLATWDLMDQTLPGEGEQREPIQRATLRRAKRAGLPARVSVIQLRRKGGSEHTGTGEPLAWRVPVREHYQHYWVKDPASGERVRVRRRIGSHWRGPEDAPVRVTDKVYDLRR